MLKSLLRLLERRKGLAAAVGRTIMGTGATVSCPYIRRDGEMNSPLQKRKMPP
jgi:hypothetical protein